MGNINTIDYWDNRFSTGHWEQRFGRSQTALFAKEYLRLVNIPFFFDGAILDFGCALGDAIPIYHSMFPKTKLLGVDHSAVAIEKCIEKYGAFADFFVGSVEEVPAVDVIIISNVLEHLDNDKMVVRELIKKCKRLFIVVPFREKIHSACNEHINSYDWHTFDTFECTQKKVYVSRGLGFRGYGRWMLGMIYRLLFKWQFRFSRPLQEIFYEIKGELK